MSHSPDPLPTFWFLHCFFFFFLLFSNVDLFSRIAPLLLLGTGSNQNCLQTGFSFSDCFRSRDQEYISLPKCCVPSAGCLGLAQLFFLGKRLSVMLCWLSAPEDLSCTAATVWSGGMINIYPLEIKSIWWLARSARRTRLTFCHLLVPDMDLYLPYGS